MHLTEQPEDVYNRVLVSVRQADEGKGVLILADMGSLLTFGKRISDETGIPTRTIAPVHTMLVMECLRKVLWPSTTLDELSELLQWPPVPANRETVDRREEAILLTCVTGKGAASSLKKLLRKHIPGLEGAVHLVEASAVFDTKQLEMYARQYKIKAVVGSIDPCLPSVPFISISEWMAGQGMERMYALLGKKQQRQEVMHPKRSVPSSSLEVLIQPEHVFTFSWKTHKDEILRRMAEPLQAGGYVSVDYLSRLMERECTEWFAFKPLTAIPHADPLEVYRPAIVVGLLDRPIEWYKGFPVQFIYMLAVKEEHRDPLRQLYRFMQEEKVRHQLRKQPDGKQFRRLLQNFLAYKGDTR
jgi:mannitol/fructose-specific phosphotransferase system IIA component (Ntr-type)